MVGDFLYHQSNLETKIRTNYGERGELFSEFKSQYYDPYRDAQVAITGIDRDSILQKISLLSGYYHQVHVLNTGGWIKPTSKFRPSILEEFCGFLFKDIPKIHSLTLDFFNKGVFAGMAINSRGKAVIKTKDIDFCIGKHFTARFENQVEDLIIPIVAIECKTYTDKTMLNEAQFTALKLKQGSPNTRVYVFSEGNQVAKKEIPLKGQTPLDQIFILRKLLPPAQRQNRNKKEWGNLDSDAILQFFSQIVSDMDTILSEKQISEFGGILLE